jgi:hypothetical protein
LFIVFVLFNLFFFFLAEWLFVPTRGAAPFTPTIYNVAGNLYYTLDGVEMNGALWPAT